MQTKRNDSAVGFLLTLFSIALATNSVIAQTDQRIDFARDIQPILSENCYFCHGPDPEQRQAGLRLDQREEAAASFVPGDADNSELIRRIESQDEGEQMPPPDSHRKLTPEQIARLRDWVDQGGQWATHWAFAPLNKPMLPAPTPEPENSNSTQPRTHPIDRFVEARLAQHNLSLPPRADRRSLIRRVSIDLTGLPPTTQQLQQFLDDDQPGAYGRMVDRYLDMPEFGERLAWVWLDAARYADSNGYQQDNERTMWPWRDWVVESFNNNLPYDQFSTWQLAGDLIPDATPEQVLATGFNRNHPINGEGGRIAEENRIDYVMDMSETAGTVWMGLTFNCCRCHDHKYDQLTQRDYYRLFAFFNQTPVTGQGGNPQTAPITPVASTQQQQQLEAMDSQLADLQQQRQQRRQEIADQQQDWEQRQRQQLASNTTWSPLSIGSSFATGAKLKQLEDGSILAAGPSRPVDTYTITGDTQSQTVSALLLETLPHPSMTNGGLSRSASSNYVLTDIKIWLQHPQEPDVPLEIKTARADYEQPGHSVDRAIDNDPQTGWAVWQPQKDMAQPHRAMFVLASPVDLPAGSRLRIVLEQQSIHDQHNIGRFRISVSSESEPSLLPLPTNLVEALNRDPKSRTPEQRKQLAAAFFAEDATLQTLNQKLDQVREQRKQLQQAIPKVMVMQDQPEPRATFVLARGSYEQPTDEVHAGVPEMFSALPENQTANRLALARWLFDDSNPLTARVAANRWWALIFGTGLVKTTEDFGVQGEPPSHPELLDWLAADYRDSGWDTKRLFRLILTSETYRQSSRVTPASRELDPENRLLSRAPRYRMPAWMIRDYALAASGLLVRQQGGPPVNSYQPPGVWEEASFGKKEYQLGTGDELYRRSIYTFWRRIAAPTIFFDNADRMTCSVKQTRTNTPLHALTTLNDTTFVEAARCLANEALKAEADPDSDQSAERQILDFMFERLLARPARQPEAEILLAGLARTREHYAADPQGAEQLISVGKRDVDGELDRVELASWTSVGLAIMNLDETLTRE